MNNIISLSLSYYDKQKKKYKKFYSNDLTFNFIEVKNELSLPKFELKRNDDLIIEGSFNIIGFYFPNEKIWKWSWNVPYTFDHGVPTKNRYYIMKKLINYALDLEFPQNKSREEITFVSDLKHYLLSSQINISHPIELEKILALSLYITHSDMIYRISPGDKNYIYENAIVYYIFTDLNIKDNLN